jgi:hypothetical protein
MIDLLSVAEFSLKNPVKKDLVTTTGSNIVLVCFGTITSGSVVHPVKPLQLVSVKKDENRGIQCNKRMVILGIRDDV